MPVPCLQDNVNFNVNDLQSFLCHLCNSESNVSMGLEPWPLWYDEIS